MRCSDPARLVELARDWDIRQATSDITGYIGTGVLADRDDPGTYVIVADFGAIDPEVPAVDEAQRHNERPETQASAERLRALATGEIEFRHFDELYRTDPIVTASELRIGQSPRRLRSGSLSIAAGG
jgi:hypothetical protein